MLASSTSSRDSIRLRWGLEQRLVVLYCLNPDLPHLDIVDCSTLPAQDSQLFMIACSNHVTTNLCTVEACLAHVITYECKIHQGCISVACVICTVNNNKQLLRRFSKAVSSDKACECCRGGRAAANLAAYATYTTASTRQQLLTIQSSNLWRLCLKSLAKSAVKAPFLLCILITLVLFCCINLLTG